MSKRIFSKKLTKQDLIDFGITNVTDDGRVFVKGKERTPIKHGRYLSISLYNPKIRAATPKELRTDHTGKDSLCIHVINYIWHNKVKEAGFVIDHRDNNPNNNHISNLQAITQRENANKDRGPTEMKTVKLSKKLKFMSEEEVLAIVNKHAEAYNKVLKGNSSKDKNNYASIYNSWRHRFKLYKEFQKTEEYKRIQEYKALLKDLEEAKKEYNAWRILTLEASNKWHDSKNKDDKYKYESAKVIMEGCKAKVKALKNKIKDLK